MLLLGENDEVMGLEWETADVEQGPMEMFGRTIEIQPGHPGAEEPHYMLHVYFKPSGKVLFGTDEHTAFDPEGVCPATSATTATAGATASATATASASAGSSAEALAETGGAFPLTPLAPLALLVGSGLLAFRVTRRG